VRYVPTWNTDGISLYSAALASGDVKVYIDGAAGNNIGTLPAVENSSGTRKITLTAAEVTGAEIVVEFIDQPTGTAFADQTVTIETEDHPSAMHPNGCLFSGTAASFVARSGATDGYMLATSGSDGVDYPAAAQETILSKSTHILYIYSATTGAGQATIISGFDYTGGTGELMYSLLYDLGLTPTGTVIYKVYEAARAPAHVIAVVNHELQSSGVGAKNVGATS